MNMHLSAQTRLAADIVEAVRAAIGEDDPDFLAIVEAETDLLERLRKMLRAARLADADASATKAIMQELAERKSRLEGRADRLRDMVKHAMQELGITKLDAPDMTISLRASAPGVEIIDMSQLPERFVRVKVEPDRAAIREALKDGDLVPGACLKNAEPALTVRNR